jgi:hypothetical protein
MWSEDRPTHTLAECHRLLDRLLTGAMLPQGSTDAAGAHTRDTTDNAARRQGLALWDVFSDNQAVLDARGVCYCLGTFRSSGDEIAAALMRHYPDSSYDYLDFYMGSALSGIDLGRATSRFLRLSRRIAMCTADCRRDGRFSSGNAPGARR